jgi:septal ring-binding cell division protein DamX
MANRATAKAHTRRPVFTLALCLALMSIAAAKERCVPDASGAWRCGSEITEADAAPLAKPADSIAPPIMLIDPARFGERDQSSQVSESMVQAELGAAPASNTTPAPKAPTPNVKPAAKPAGVVPVQPANSTNTAIRATNHTDSSSGYVVQLALASTPRGFDALLKGLGAGARNSQRRQLKNGTWVLLLGDFATLELARAAIPSASVGAFARAISSLPFR